MKSWGDEPHFSIASLPACHGPAGACGRAGPSYGTQGRLGGAQLLSLLPANMFTSAFGWTGATGCALATGVA